MSIPVVIDCDNTAGIPGCEIDDALALLYLLAHPDVEVVGVTTTFGNGTRRQATEQTKWLLEVAGRQDVPVIEGASGPGERNTDASRFLVECCRSRPGEIQVIAIGPLTNIAAAASHCPDFFAVVAGIHAMGGYTEPLVFSKRRVDELNLSADSEAAHMVLHSPAPVHLMTAQLCLGLPFRQPDLRRLAGFPRWFRNVVGDWYLTFTHSVGAAAFYLWDLVPPLSLLCEDWVPRRFVRITSTASDLETGRILFTTTGDETDPRDPGIVNMPMTLADDRKIKAELFASWKRAMNGDHP